jgi:hypothetical protein
MASKIGRLNAEIITARIELGRELIEAQKHHRVTEVDWVIYLGSRNISRSQSQDVMRLARRFGDPALLSRLLEFGPSYKILMKLCSRSVSEEETRIFLTEVAKYHSDSQCEIALAEIQKSIQNKALAAKAHKTQYSEVLAVLAHYTTLILKHIPCVDLHLLITETKDLLEELEAIEAAAYD